ncbi:VOC family protein [Pseudomonas veronii]|uniref:2,3-dihydroxybiphenyl 1,2-dioxygenase n=1 Tax=Pseudomonas veronii TaxID=76761 RepID=A0A4P7YA14_PSEVE|nr:VOC family protein [Pseudomonas veronii]QCG68162.1 2,3-dihydroxybiphenyl 1,2-dioxygenase [Pseudomonas veronii]
MDIIGIGYLGFESPDLDAWREYAPQVLGLGIGASPATDPNSLYLRSDDRRHRIALHKGPLDRLAYIGWEARGRLAYNQALTRFRDAGVELSVGDATLCETRGVRELVRFCCPAGYQHELFYAQKWTPRSFVPGRPHGGFVGDERGVGHIVLMTPDYSDELEQFFTGLMGFHWYGAGAGKGRTGFFRAKLNDKTSHDIAFGHAPGHKGVQHIGLFVKSLRDVGETFDIVKQRGLPMQMTLGQHSQDPHVSFYHFSPSGFAVECIYELEPWHHDGFELNPQKLSLWGHELVGPILGSSVRALESLPQD